MPQRERGLTKAMGLHLLTIKILFTNCENLLKSQLCFYLEGRFMGDGRRLRRGPPNLGTYSDGEFKGQDDPWRPGAEAEGKWIPKIHLVSFFPTWLKTLMWILEEKIAYAPFTFISWEFSGFDQHLLCARLCFWFVLSLPLITALWGEDVNFPFCRWQNWRLGRLTFTISPDSWLQDPRWKASLIWPVFFPWHHPPCPGIIMGNHWPQWNHPRLWEWAGIWGAVHLQKERKI